VIAMSVDFRSLQERLRQRLLAEIDSGKLTGMELARLTGFRQAHISNFLNRKRGLSLEAMDAILKVRRFSLAELMAWGRPQPAKRLSLHAAAEERTYIPLVDGKTCHASEVPYSPAKDTLQVMSGQLQKLSTHMAAGREHWQRFVGYRVTADDARAMAPRLARDTVAVIDRHCHQVDGASSMYLVLHRKNMLLRYVERVEDDFILRPESPGHGLMRLHGGATAIVGRVCMVIAKV
jgi:hypothetical protein